MPRRRSILLIIMSLAWVGVSCAPRGPAEKEPGVYESPGGIKFSVKVTPPAFALGEPVTLEASLFNDGKEGFDQQFPNACVWNYQVANESGRVFGPNPMCATVVTDFHLEPGELRVIMREWKGNDRYFDLSEPLPPGRYSVTAGFVDGPGIIPMSEPVWIDIAAPRKKR